MSLWSNYLFPCDCWVKDLFAITEKGLNIFPCWELTFESSLSKGLNVLAIFRYVVKKIEVFSEGKTRKKFSASGFAFERLTFLSKVENRLKRGESLCENFTRGDILNFKKCLDNGNLWFFFAFLFSVASWPHPFVTENQILIWSYSKRFFWSVLARF